MSLLLAGRGRGNQRNGTALGERKKQLPFGVRVGVELCDVVQLTLAVMYRAGT